MPRDLIREAEIAAPLDADGEVYLRAIEIIERDGWMSHLAGAPMPNNYMTARCMMRSIGAARGNEQDGYGNGDANRLGFSCFQEAFQWNDAPGRTASEVIARLRAAARGQL